MGSDPSRGLFGRWPRARPQALRAPWVVALALVVALGLALAACQAGEAVRPAPTLPRVPARELIVRTSSFAFRMGADVDRGWPDKAEETRLALGARLPELLEEEEVTVPILARQLGIAWPADPIEFDVALTDDQTAPCDAKIARLLYVGGGDGPAFFACALERGLGRLAREGALYRGLTGAVPREDERARADALHACIVAYAVAAVSVARAASANEARAAEARLGGPCAPGALDWLGHEWVKRVRGDETAEAFGARAARALSGSVTSP